MKKSQIGETTRSVDSLKKFAQTIAEVSNIKMALKKITILAVEEDDKTDITYLAFEFEGSEYQITPDMLFGWALKKINYEDDAAEADTKEEKEMKKTYGVKNMKSGMMVIGTDKKVRVTEDKALAQQLADKMAKAHEGVEYKVVEVKDDTKTEAAKELAPEAPKAKKTATKKETKKPEPKKEAPAPQPEAEEAPKKTGKKVLLMTFTGMEIGEYDITKKTSSTVTIQTKGGEQKFSLKDMKQIGAKHPKFANKIKLV